MFRKSFRTICVCIVILLFSQIVSPLSAIAAEDTLTNSTAIDDIQYAALSQFASNPFNTLIDCRNWNVSNIIVDDSWNLIWDQSISNKTWDDLYKSVISSWTILDYDTQNDEYGFQGIAFVNQQSKRIVIAYFSNSNISDSIFMFSNENNSLIQQIQFADIFYKKIASLSEYKDYLITTTGQLAGGIIASYEALTHDTYAVTFNSPSITHDMLLYGVFKLNDHKLYEEFPGDYPVLDWLSLPANERVQYLDVNSSIFHGFNLHNVTNHVNENCNGVQGSANTNDSTLDRVILHKDLSGFFNDKSKLSSYITFENEEFKLSEKTGELTINGDDDYIKTNGIYVDSGNVILGNSKGAVIKNDTFRLGYVCDYLYGGDGNDTIEGNFNWDFIIGNRGNDILKGYGGSDFYLFSPGDGEDTIDDTEGNNIIVFSKDIAPANISITQIKDSLGEIKYQISYSYSDKIIFSKESLINGIYIYDNTSLEYKYINFNELLTMMLKKELVQLFNNNVFEYKQQLSDWFYETSLLDENQKIPFMTKLASSLSTLSLSVVLDNMNSAEISQVPNILYDIAKQQELKDATESTEKIKEWNEYLSEFDGLMGMAGFKVFDPIGKLCILNSGLTAANKTYATLKVIESINTETINRYKELADITTNPQIKEKINEAIIKIQNDFYTKITNMASVGVSALDAITLDSASEISKVIFGEAAELFSSSILGVQIGSTISNKIMNADDILELDYKIVSCAYMKNDLLVSAISRINDYKNIPSNEIRLDIIRIMRNYYTIDKRQADYFVELNKNIDEGIAQNLFNLFNDSYKNNRALILSKSEEDSENVKNAIQFIESQYDLIIQQVPSESFSLIVSNLNGNVTRSPDKSVYLQDEIVQLTATPNQGYVFTGWSGGYNSSSPTISIKMDSNKSIVANFTQNLYGSDLENLPEEQVSEQENNNTQERAQTISPHSKVTGKITLEDASWNGDILGQDDDYYKIVITEEGYLHYDFTSDVTLNNDLLQMTINKFPDPDNTFTSQRITSSGSETESQVVKVTPGIYYIDVCSSSGWNSIGNYTFNISYSKVDNGVTPIFVSDVNFSVNNVKQIESSEGYYAVLLNDGSLWMRGFNQYGQLGIGSYTDERNYFIKVMDNVSKVSLGGLGTLILKDDKTLWSCGITNWRQLGGGSNVPVKIADDIINMCAGPYNSYFIKEDGSLWGWGDNSFGQLGPSIDYLGTTTPVKLMENVIDVSVSYSHVMAITNNSELWTWGDNRKGQLGNDTTISQNEPIKVMTDVLKVCAGQSHSTALKKDGTLLEWGVDYGVDGENVYNTKPIIKMQNVIDVSSKYDHTLAITKDNRLWGWGRNGIYDCVSSGDAFIEEPKLISGGVCKISSGLGTSFASMNDGTLWYWGWWLAGQFTAHVPTQLSYELSKIIEYNKIPSTNGIKIGDYIQFGRYYNKPILWKVTNINNDGSISVWSDKILTIKAFDAPETLSTNLRYEAGSNRWANSNLREWLNGKLVVNYTTQPPQNDTPTSWNGNASNGDYSTEPGFLSNFSDEELNLIQPVTNKCPLSTLDVNEKDGGTEPITLGGWGNSITNFDNVYYENVTDLIYMLDTKEIFDISNKCFNVYKKITQEAILYANFPTNWVVPPDSEYMYWCRDAGDDYNVFYQSNVFCSSLGSPKGTLVGVVPALTIKSCSQIINGLGTLEQPYKIASDNYFSINVISENGYVTNSQNKTVFQPGESVTLKAEPKSGYVFKNWGGDVSGTNSTITVNMDCNKEIKAIFEKIDNVSNIPVSSISFKSSTTLNEGQTEQLIATISPSNATDKNVQWTVTSGSDVVSVVDGLVTALKAGTATVRATSTGDSSKYAECVVTVKVPVNSVTIKSSTTLNEGQTEQLTATISPSNATDKNVQWTVTSGSDVVSVVDGLVTALKAGTATVRATSTDDGSKYAECVVTVKVPVNSVSIKSNTILNEGQTEQLTATISPSNATDKNVLWTVTSGSNVVSVVDGLVTALKAGTVTVRATSTDDSSKYAECTVIVIPQDKKDKVRIIKKYRAACPVNMEVYNDKNEVVATITDQGPQNQIYDFGYLYCADENGDKVKTAYLFNDNYKIRIKGTGAGSMNFSITGLNEVGDTAIVHTYNNIPITDLTVIDIDPNNQLVVDNNSDGICETRIDPITDKYDDEAPVITIGSYNTSPTNQDVIVYAASNEGLLNKDSHIFIENGSFTFTAIDAAGNTSNKEVVITNIDKIPPKIETNINDYSVLPVGTSIEFSSTDPNSNESVNVIAKLISGTEESDITNGFVPAVGVYGLKITAKDLAGNVTEKNVNFVIYDPDGGFVTGGGWINSTAGAYAINLELSGKATFSFVSRYKNGAAIPTGQTEFQFKAGGLNFQSTSYDWLVVAGSKAQFKGKGTINGQGEYGFMLTAIDGDLKDTDKNDRFRIKIWDIASGNIVYDNQINTADGTDLTSTATMLGGGSIVIHK